MKSIQFIVIQKQYIHSMAAAKAFAALIPGLK
jgi:hypothetical protein